jgi:hypothetical protein
VGLVDVRHARARRFPLAALAFQRAFVAVPFPVLPPSIVLAYVCMTYRTTRNEGGPGPDHGSGQASPHVDRMGDEI